MTDTRLLAVGSDQIIPVTGKIESFRDAAFRQMVEAPGTPRQQIVLNTTIVIALHARLDGMSGIKIQNFHRGGGELGQRRLGWGRHLHLTDRHPATLPPGALPGTPHNGAGESTK